MNVLIQSLSMFGFHQILQLLKKHLAGYLQIHKLLLDTKLFNIQKNHPIINPILVINLQAVFLTADEH